MAKDSCFFHFEIGGLELLFSEETPREILGHEKWRLEHGFYLLPKPGTKKWRVVDLSPNYGVWAIYLAALHPGARIIACEPIQERYAVLLKNIQLNAATSITALNAGAFDKDATLYYSDHNLLTDKKDIATGDGRHRFSEKNASPIPGEILQEPCDILRVASPGATLPVLSRLPASFTQFICGEASRTEASPRSLQQALSRVAPAGALSISGFQPPEIPKVHAHPQKTKHDLTVIVPIYNVAQFLPRCVDSILEQQDLSTEILLVDDGSTDTSPDIAKAYEKKHPNVRHIRQENAGCAAARQNGLQQATGKYVAFVDSDDWLSANALSRAYELACLDSPDIVQFGYTKVYEKTQTREFIDGHPLAKYENKLIRPPGIQDFMYGPPSIWRRIYNREFLTREKLGFATQFRRYDDLPFQFETLATAKTMRVLPEEHYFYRLDRPGQDVSANDERLLIHFDLLNHVLEFIQERKITQTFLPVAMTILIASHSWALRKIKKECRDQYIQKLKNDTKTAKLYLENKRDLDKILSKKQRRFLGKFMGKDNS
jgi:glycosyltransferase involved in cell wall biosynthesis